MNKRRKNNLIIISLCAVVILMGIGYAAFSSQLNITGTSNITSNWDVRITNIESELNGATDVSEPSYDNTNGLYASFHTGLSKPGDYALYTITIENRGDIDARIEKINSYYQENEYVTFTLSGLNKGDVIEGHQSKELNPLPADEYYVTYDYTTNGGESSNAVNDYVAENTEVNLSYTASKTGYEFMGWNTDREAVTGLESYMMPANNTTLYAIFRKIDTTPPVIDNVSTTSTTNSITVVTTATEADGEITKYEYKIDNSEYVEGSNAYTFTGLTQGTSHTIKVRVTNGDNLQVESEAKEVSTSVLDKPTFSEVETDNGKTVTITYPEGEDLTYEYQKDSGEWQIATQNQQVSFTESGTLVARVSDGTNEASASYSIEVGVNMGGINLPVVEIGDGLYKDAYEEDLYIYRGGNPNNYVRFSNNLWQIISINTETNTIKIMAPSSIYFLEPYDTESGRYLRTGYCSSNEYGCNIWGSKSTLYNVNMQPITSLPRSVDDSYSYELPTEEAYLNTYLNTTYYNTYISAESKSMLTEGIFKVGMVKSDSSQTLKTDIEQASSVKWKGKVGVIDVTEYVRASTNPLCTGLYAYDSNSSCYSELDSNYMTTPNDAYDFWTLTPAERSGDTGYVYRIMGDSGDVHLNVADYESYRPRPVVTLSSSVKITGGDGSSGNPYQLSL